MRRFCVSRKSVVLAADTAALADSCAQGAADGCIFTHFVVFCYRIHQMCKRTECEVEKTKRIITLFLAIVCALALCVTAGAADTSVITDMKTDCVVDAAGSCQITQTVTIDIAGTEDTIELPLAAGAKRISVAGYKYKKTTQDGYTVLVLLSNGGFAGSRTFTISYTVSGLVSEQDKIQTLTLPLLAPKWNWAINNYDFTITLPAAFEGYPTFTSGYYGDVIEDYMNFTVREGMIGGTISTALKDHESLTMTLDVGEGYFAGRYASWSSGWVETALVIVFSVLALLYWALTLRSRPLRVSSRTAPPDAAAPRWTKRDMCFCTGRSSWATSASGWNTRFSRRCLPGAKFATARAFLIKRQPNRPCAPSSGTGTSGSTRAQAAIRVS